MFLLSNFQYDLVATLYTGAESTNQTNAPTSERAFSVAVSDTCDTYTFEHILGLQKCKMLKCVSGTVFILCLLQTHIAHPSVKGLYFR